MRPLALAFFQRNVVDGELLVAQYVGCVDDVQPGVFYLHRKGNVFGNHKRKSAGFFVASTAYGHAVSNEGVCAVKVFYHLYRFSVTAHAQTHQALEDVFAALRLVFGLHRAAVRVVGKVLQHALYVVVRYHLVAVQHDKVVVVGAVG